MDAARERTSDVVSALVENHRRFLSFLMRRVGNRSDAKGILQAAFVKSMEKADSIRDTETAVAWFCRLLQNAVIDYYHHRDAERRALEHWHVSATQSRVPDENIERAVCQCVNDLLQTLKDDYSSLLRRVDLEGASISEVAAETGMTSNSTRVKLHRARRALRKQLELSCGSCAEHGCLDCSCRRPA